MSQKVFNQLWVTGFSSEEERRGVRGKTAYKEAAFSLKRILPLNMIDPIELELDREF